jgi:hypothetical protein
MYSALGKIPVNHLLLTNAAKRLFIAASNRASEAGKQQNRRDE